MVNALHRQVVKSKVEKRGVGHVMVETTMYVVLNNVLLYHK